MRVVLHLLLPLALVVVPSWRAQASSYVCDGDALSATIDRGAVDAIGIPNSVDGTVPGSFVVLEWRDLHLQLPRTNNAEPVQRWQVVVGSRRPRAPGLPLRQGAGRANCLPATQQLNNPSCQTGREEEFTEVLEAFREFREDQPR